MSAPGKVLVFVLLMLDLKVLGCQKEVYLVVNLLAGGMPGCCPGQLARVESVGKGESVALCELKKTPSSVVCLSSAKSSYCLCPIWHASEPT